MESNSLHPYEIAEEADLTYSFTTRHGITYHAYFLDYSCYYPAFANVYTFNIEPEEDTPHPIDKHIALTIIHILRQFFSRNENAMIMICGNLDGKEQKREMLPHGEYDFGDSYYAIKGGKTKKWGFLLPHFR